MLASASVLPAFRHSPLHPLLQVTDGVFQRLEKCVVMLARGMSLEQVKDSVLQDVESYFTSAGLLDDTPQQKPGLRVRIQLALLSLPCFMPLPSLQEFCL